MLRPPMPGMQGLYCNSLATLLCLSFTFLNPTALFLNPTALPGFPPMFNAGANMTPSMMSTGFQGGVHPLMGNPGMSVTHCTHYPPWLRAISLTHWLLLQDEPDVIVCAAANGGNGRHSTPPLHAM